MFCVFVICECVVTAALPVGVVGGLSSSCQTVLCVTVSITCAACQLVAAAVAAAASCTCTVLGYLLHFSRLLLPQ